MQVTDSENSSAKDTLESVKKVLGEQVVSSKVTLGTAEITIKSTDILSAFTKLKEALEFNFFVNVTAVDFLNLESVDDPDVDEALGIGDERFQLVYHLLSLKRKDRVRIKVAVSESNTEVDSVTSLWPGANFMESEVYDMYGITFKGHPNLRRILMYDEFKGYPLRKDYPVQGKQPRVNLISPEVENTAKQMLRPSLQANSLVQIKKKSA